MAALATMLFSCSEEVVETPAEEKFPISISVGVPTRANDSAFESGDAVGVYVVNYDGATAGTLQAEGNQADNTKFTFNGGAWNSDETIYWKDKSTATDFYAYYPYSASVDIAAHQFDVKADQSNEANFWASDFLWGKTANVVPTSSAVAIQTNHSLSRIIVEVKPGSGFTAAAWAAATKSVKICDVKTSATINLATGVATATGDAGEIVPFATTSNYKAMMVPQTVADDSKLVVVTVDGTEYVYRTGYTFKANTQHSFSILVNKEESSVNVTIGEWEIDQNITNGSAEEEVDEAFVIANNQIGYTSTSKVEPKAGVNFGASITKNEWNSSTGRGIITFDGDVTKIGDAAFKGCASITSVILPESLTTIGYEAFKSCKLIETITIPANVTLIDGDAFYACSGMTTLYCKSIVPAELRYGAIDGGAANRTIYVPMESVDAYKKSKSSDYGWINYASSIVGYDFN